MEKTVSLVILSVLLGACSYAGSGETSGQVRQGLTADDYGLKLSLPFQPTQSHILSRAYSPVPGDTVRWTHSGKDRYALDMYRSGSEVRILAAHPGVVIFAGLYGDYGYQVLIQNEPTGLVSRYAHMRKDSLMVGPGDSVERGAWIGLEGGTPNWSQHLHFVLYSVDSNGNYVGVKAEPFGGYDDMQSLVGRTIGIDYPILPVGTVVKDYDRPEIYVVCGRAEICHVSSWDTFRTMRFFHDSMNPMAQVVEIPEGDLACYTRGPDISGVSERHLISCWGREYLYISEQGHSIRRRVPFDRSTETAVYDRLIRSWGFTRDELRSGKPGECLVDESEPLCLRDGTLIELVTDNDFYVVTADRWESEANPTGDHGYVMRVHRERDGKPFMPLLYRDFDNVTMVPSDAVYTMTSGARSGKSVFTPELARECPGNNGQLADQGPPPVGGQSYEPSVQEDPPHTVRCEATPSGLAVTVTGPLLDGTALMATPSSPSCLSLGADGYGWPDTGHSVAWQGDGVSHSILLPASLIGFNLYLADSTATGDYWLKLRESDGSPWSVVGDCHMGSGLVLAGEADDASPQEQQAEPEDPEEADSPHTIRCEASESGTTVTVTGPLLDGTALMATPPNPAHLALGSNGYGWPASAYYTTWQGDGFVHQLTVPLGVFAFNLKASSDGDYWLRLKESDGSPWAAAGDCRIGSGLIEVTK